MYMVILTSFGYFDMFWKCDIIRLDTSNGMNFFTRTKKILSRATHSCYLTNSVQVACKNENKILKFSTQI